MSTSYTVRAADARRRRAGPRDRGPARADGDLGPQRILTAKRPVDLRRGRPVSLLVGPPVYVDPGDRPARGHRPARRTPAGDARRPAGPAGAPAARPGEHRTVAPGPPRGRRPGRRRRPQAARVGAAERRSRRPGCRAGERSARRVGSRCASASRRWSRPVVRRGRARRGVGGRVEIGSTSLLSRRRHRGRGEQQARPARRRR